MSDNWINLVPTDPWFVPTEESQALARRLFLRIAPEADEIKLVVSDTVQLRDCGTNLNRISCPSCHRDVDRAWWKHCMVQDHDGSGFKLQRYKLACCASVRSLHELVYDWPQAFSRFSLEAMNPNIGKLPEDSVPEFEKLLVTPIVVIYQHI